MNINDVELAIRSGSKLIVIETDEEYRVLDDIFDNCKYANIYTWTPTSALRQVIDPRAWNLDRSKGGTIANTTGGTSHEAPIEPIVDAEKVPITHSIEVISYIMNQNPENYNLWVMRHLDISQDMGFENARKIKDYYPRLGKNVLIVLTDNANINQILARDYTLIQYSLMNTKECNSWLNGEICNVASVAKSSPFRKVWVNGEEKSIKSAYKLNYTKTEINNIAGAITGLTQQEMSTAFATSFKKLGRLDQDTIAATKRTIVEKSGLLEWVIPISMDEVGGLEILKDFLVRRKVAINNPDAVSYGLPYPKGAILLGLPGSGKSLICKATAGLLELPLVRIDIGRIMQSLVGASESNMRKLITVLEAISPVVVWLDEIEKSMAGVQSSTFSDSGTFARVFSTFLTWAQERNCLAFIMATCNAMMSPNGQLLIPAELTRAGRFDKVSK